MLIYDREGKIRYLGLSEVAPSTIRRACAVHQISAHQVEYNPFSLWPEAELVPVHRELGVATVAYAPTGRGFLTGQVKSLDDLPPTDFRRLVSRATTENFAKILTLVEKFKAVGEKHGKSPAQISIAWMMAQGEELIPMPGTRTAKYVEENTEAGNIKLSDEEV
jgi:aryl-alcohol dehydrogenase-like predicted oxidoreductase